MKTIIKLFVQNEIGTLYFDSPSSVSSHPIDSFKLKKYSIPGIEDGIYEFECIKVFRKYNNSYYEYLKQLK